ncbi:hypothetical protein C8R48DRAFT_679627 [Suillus tomentosus]|nr:hypothetical protein C8R48DRAFT_679627 [Suillus tomentosus]
MVFLASSPAQRLRGSRRVKHGGDDNDAAGTSAPKPPPSRPFKVVRPSFNPIKVVPKPPATQSEVIELTSTEENPIEEPDTEYEDAAHGKKRKLKAGNTSRVLKKVAPSTEKADAPKVGKKGVRGKNDVPSKVPPAPLPTANTSPVKGGPLSPLTVGSSSDDLPSPEHSKAGKAIRLRDGPSDQPKRDRVKPRPVTKNSQVMMKRRLRMAYRDSDSEADVDESMKADSTTTTNVIPKATGSANIVSEEKSTQPTKDEGVRDMEELPPTSPLNAVTPTIPNQQALRDSNTPRPGTPPLSMSLEMVVTLDATHSTTIHAILSTTLEMVVTIHATPLLMKTLEVPFATLHTTLKRFNSREALHSHDHHYIRTYSQEPARALDRDALHPRDAFYYRDSRNPRYVSPQDLYGSGDIRAESDLNTRDSSPTSDFHGNYGLGTYRPHRDDLDEREQSLSPYRSRHVGGGHYRESRYPQGPSRRFQDSRWDDAAHFDYGHDGVPRGFSRDRPPRPPPAA